MDYFKGIKITRGQTTQMQENVHGQGHSWKTSARGKVRTDYGAIKAVLMYIGKDCLEFGGCG